MSVSVRATGDGLVVGAAAAALLAAANDNRDRVIIHNQQFTLYVKLGTGASSSDFTFRLTSGATLELDGYIGPITAIASQDSTYVRMTELV